MYINLSLLDTFVVEDDQRTKIQYFIGARKKHGTVYRWENGPAVQHVYAENQVICFIFWVYFYGLLNILGSIYGKFYIYEKIKELPMRTK